MGKGSKAKGRKHAVVELPLKSKPKDDPPTEDLGSFTFGYCTSCDWRGPARRSRDKARAEAKHHSDLCKGKGKVHVGATDTKDVEDLKLP